MRVPEAQNLKQENMTLEASSLIHYETKWF